ncbi:hypothetical protein PVL29_004658 [Vitis rotundifolia]|uniref:Uncharacterized protein n=1 Tax=Vitis rotundifolia TaxID=103349 RepID=A0AA39A8Q8_VITRO|nr:hypothetical protein PVL29_004658 [Vitis rotundifolia]
MEFRAGGNGSGGDQDGPNPRRGRKVYNRHTPQQIQRLEAFFKDCPHPDEAQRRQLGRELGLESRQIKFWFQNKRTQTKTQHERADNTALRAENERIQCENLAIREALKNVICPSCGGPPFGEEERQRNIEKLQLENAQLKEEHEKVSNLLAKYIGKPITQMHLLPPALGSSLDLSPGSFPSQETGGLSIPTVGPALGLDLAPVDICNASVMYQFKGFPDMEKTLMTETAAGAMDELIRLVRINEPLWVKSATNEKYVLHHDSYERIFPKATHFKSSNARIESSKESVVVAMNGMQLVNMFLDPNKYVDLFPTIITKASTIQVLEAGLIGSRSGSLQLMYEQMHILSPLVAPREFYFLRYCQQIEVGVWVIVDVSYDYSKEGQPNSSFRFWKLPSGCMIQDLPDGCSKVTWVEHVEVDDKSLTHRLYRDLVSGSLAFGAERMVGTLQRMCERLAYLADENTPTRDLAGVISLPEGRRSIMKLGHRMVKDFCGVLSMSGKLDFPQLSEVDNSGVRVSVRKSTEPGQPGGMIVSAATSLWLPMHCQTIFDFIRDEKMRPQPFVPTENNMLMLQESCVEPLGGLVVYAPIDIPAINVAIRGEESGNIPILPSGFIVSGDGRPDSGAGCTSDGNIMGSGGSLLTVAFQVLVCGPAAPQQQMNMESVATVNTLISSTVQKIKIALNCSGLD